MHLLLLHGNGGSKTRFLPFLDLLREQHPDLTPVIPRLSGFDGRALPAASNYWDLFLSEVERAISEHPAAENWVFYGHGIGGSLLMELAAREYQFPAGLHLIPQKVILNSVIGASLDQRFFPQLMKPNVIRQFMQYLIAAPWMRPIWEKRLFQDPAQIPLSLRKQFFQDYAQCAAFPVFFDLITVDWYRGILPLIQAEPFLFLWGESERIVSARYLTLWRRDFPGSTFEVISHWDHFPMLDDPQDFTDNFVNLLPA
ncbi:MAG: alpha/beta fold hydrolase [Bacteroidota bacterium]